ncbi:hypothetical protein WN51_06151 [Melipona quadrifasciata]|uniref:Uncharacterized protein n=1 Tax=Melipona quadrifasciata TaxID=166423 RepID=A0A0M8ZPG7_9HYME|nr:hypothetical protein WN51_06151 [Melipona quadrifasciata]
MSRSSSRAMRQDLPEYLHFSLAREVSRFRGREDGMIAAKCHPVWYDKWMDDG